PQLLAALGGGFAPEVKDALWDLVWSGELTNDSLHPVRAFLRPPAARHARRRGPSQRGLSPQLAGRWSLVSSYASDATKAATERAKPYGAALSWPERESGGKPMRVAGSLVILVDGTLAAYVARDEHSVLTFIEGEDRDVRRIRELVARALAAEAVPERRDP